MNGFTFDAGALIAVDRRERNLSAIVAWVAKEGWTITIPSTALAQVVRNPSRQANLLRLLKRGYVVIVPLSEDDAVAVGELLAKSGTKDIADAHVAICAIRAGQAIVTSDPNDLRRLAPDCEIVRV